MFYFEILGYKLNLFEFQMFITHFKADIKFHFRFQLNKPCPIDHLL